jgi:hypothetical protein
VSRTAAALGLDAVKDGGVLIERQYSFTDCGAASARCAWLRAIEDDLDDATRMWASP